MHGIASGCIAWSWLSNNLDNVWPCEACRWMDNLGLPCDWFSLLQNDDNYNMRHAIERHEHSMCYVVKIKQGDGEKWCSSSKL